MQLPSTLWKGENMLSLKSEKGFTLVELLVSMCILAIVMTELMALMFNSSKLYKNGAYEVSLQSEAQQIIQQFEELAIDADTSVSYNEVSNIINITNGSGYSSYELSLVPVDGKDYNDLMLKVDAGTPQIMGEYVKSISLNMANYDTASRVVLIVEMQNDKYSYTAAKDIYLRNDIGSGDNNSSAVVSEACDQNLNVLRFKEYDLKALYGDYAYAFVEVNHFEYFYSGPTTLDIQGATSDQTSTWSATVKTSASMNATTGDNFTPQYVVQAYSWDASLHQYVPEFKVKVYSEKVSVGINNSALLYLSQGTTNEYFNYFSFEGISIDPSAISSIDVDFCYAVSVNRALYTDDDLTLNLKYDSDTDQVVFTGGNYSRKDEVVKSFGPYDDSGDLLSGVSMGNSAGKRFTANVQGGANYGNLCDFGNNGPTLRIDPENNDLVCAIKCDINAEAIGNLDPFLKTYAVPYIRFTVHYNAGTPNARDLELNAYAYPIGENYSVDDDLRDRIFEVANYY